MLIEEQVTKTLFFAKYERGRKREIITCDERSES